MLSDGSSVLSIHLLFYLFLPKSISNQRDRKCLPISSKSQKLQSHHAGKNITILSVHSQMPNHQCELPICPVWINCPDSSGPVYCVDTDHFHCKHADKASGTLFWKGVLNIPYKAHLIGPDLFPPKRIGCWILASGCVIIMKRQERSWCSSNSGVRENSFTAC